MPDDHSKFYPPPEIDTSPVAMLKFENEVLTSLTVQAMTEIDRLRSEVDLLKAVIKDIRALPLPILTRMAICGIVLSANLKGVS